jgi:hypothetical protein
MLTNVVDVTAITGQGVAGPVRSWVTPDGPFLVEHLAGQSPTGDLLVFYWSPRRDWQAVNVTAITGQKIAGPVTSWVTPDGPFLVEHLAGQSPSGDLLVFFWSPRHDWQAVNVTAITGQKVAGPVTSWVTPVRGQGLMSFLVRVHMSVAGPQGPPRPRTAAKPVRRPATAPLHPGRGQ